LCKKLFGHGSTEYLRVPWSINHFFSPHEFVRGSYSSPKSERVAFQVAECPDWRLTAGLKTT
jgi:hypothetical protein